MASFLAHAALPVVAIAGMRVPDGERGRLMVTAAICSALPDLDMITAVFEIRVTDPHGHRGLSHSLVMAALIALFATCVAFQRLGFWSREWKRVLIVLFAATASHGILDAMTTHEMGVALFAPLSDARFFLPWKLLPSSPVGAKELFGPWGLFTIANELLYLLLPVGIVTAFRRAREEERPRLLRAALLWAAMAIALRMTVPEYFAPRLPRVVRAMPPQDGLPDMIPHDDLPEGKLVTRWSELEARGLVNRPLAPASALWSSSFFPSWFGGEGGRWSEGRWTLVWRTMFGFPPPTTNEARAWTEAAARGDEAAKQRLFTLSPTEKVDLAYGRLDFPATVQSLEKSHNGHPRFWHGRCNGISMAAMTHPEPYRVVDVTALDGTHIPFHPQDVKALLSVVYDWPTTELIVGKMCNVVNFDAGATCSMNPALLAIGLANRIGIAKSTFLVDEYPTIAKQYYAVAQARIDVVRAPRAPAGEPTDPAFAPRVAKLVDVVFDLTLSSTTLRYDVGDRKDPSDPSGTTYRRVGLVPVPMRHPATLALDKDGELIGGVWTGDPPDGPDDMIIVGGPPRLVDNEMLVHADKLPWPLIRELAKASVDPRPGARVLDLRTQCDGACVWVSR